MLVLIQQIMLPNPCVPSRDKVQTTPAEDCCKGGSCASVQLHGFGQLHHHLHSVLKIQATGYYKF